MLYQILQYIKFCFKSTNEHGVHSPFVFNLVTTCFYDKTTYLDYKKIATYRKDLIANKSTINVKDLGFGSHKTTSNSRSVSNIAKHAGTSCARAKLMYRVVKYFNCNSILELGTSLGIATQAMGLGNPKATILSIEGCPNISEFTIDYFNKQALQNISVINKDFKLAIAELKSKSFDLVFFDGNHQKESTLLYFNILLTTTHNDSLFIFDDIYWSKEMTEAWETIKQHPKVTVTIDTFFWGLVFFRKEQPKEHFKIRV